MPQARHRGGERPAVGIGVTMQLAMDMRIASKDARFGFVFARRGIVPEAASSWFLPRLVGISPGAGVVLFRPRVRREGSAGGRLVSEHRRTRGGSGDRARAIAREIIDNTAPVSIALIRQMMWRRLGMDHPMEAHKVDSRGIYARGPSADVREGVWAFLEKRPRNSPGRCRRECRRFSRGGKRGNTIDPLCVVCRECDQNSSQSMFGYRIRICANGFS